MCGSSTLMVLHRKELPSGCLTRPSNNSNILLRGRELQALERLPVRVKREYQLQRCCILLKSSELYPEGSDSPKYLSTVTESQSAAKLVKFIDAASIENAEAVFLRKGVYCITISLQSTAFSFMIRQIKADSFAHFSSKLESYLTDCTS